VSINSILSNTNAFIDGSDIQSANDIHLDASSTSNINATVVSASLSLGYSGTTGAGVSLGVSVARNFIGYEHNGDENRSSVKAYVKDSGIFAMGRLSQEAVAHQIIHSIVVSGSAAVAGGTTTGVAVSGSGVWSENKVAVDIESTINNENNQTVHVNDLSLSATDFSDIFAFAGASSIAASFGATGVSFSLGVSLGQNLIANSVLASIENGTVETTTGDIMIYATQDEKIHAITSAASIAASFGVLTSISISGAGAEAKNVILTQTNAHIANAALTIANDLDITASNESEIKALVLSASVGAASVGVTIARNYIGWSPYNIGYDYTLEDNPDTILSGNKIAVTEGVRKGDVYEYIGSETLERSSIKSFKQNITEVNDVSTNKIYKYIGPDAELDLYTLDFTNTNTWEFVTEVIPYGEYEKRYREEHGLTDYAAVEV
ncbi:MAG: hypothetical protein OMM_13383, partial [Candidatus Magnetoglobus multicellularis str. Araruama]